MIEDGILIEKKGRIYAIEASWVIRSTADALEQARKSTQHFEQKLVGSDGASLAHLTGSIPRQSCLNLRKSIAFIEDIVHFKNSETSGCDDSVSFF